MPSEKCVDVTVHLSESTLIIRPPLGVTQVQQILQTLTYVIAAQYADL
jgi:hypothetical protein